MTHFIFLACLDIWNAKCVCSKICMSKDLSIVLEDYFSAHMALFRWQLMPHQYIIDFFGQISLKSKISSYFIQLHGLDSRGLWDPYFMRQIHGPHFLFINWDHNPRYHQHQHMDRVTQWIKAHGPYYLSYTHGKRLPQQKPIFTQNNNKTRGTSSHLRLMTQAYKSLLGETLGVMVWRAKRYV